MLILILVDEAIYKCDLCRPGRLDQGLFVH